MPDYETILFKARGPVARITLNRPDRLNSFTAQMHEELRDALGRLGDARVVVLTGADRGFSARGHARDASSIFARKFLRIRGSASLPL